MSADTNINPDSLTPQEIRLEALQRMMPEIFCEGKIDWEKLKATLGTDIDFSNERYVLNWAGKSDAFRLLQKPSRTTLCSERGRKGCRDKGKGMRGNIGLQHFDYLARNSERDLFNSEEIAERESEKINDYYSIDDSNPVLLLESISQEIVDAMITAQPNKVIALDKLFNGNDQLKINTALQMCDSGMEFRMV